MEYLPTFALKITQMYVNIPAPWSIWVLQDTRLSWVIGGPRGCFFFDLPLGAPSGALCGDVQMSRAVAREKSGRRAMWEKMAAINLKFGDD